MGRCEVSETSKPVSAEAQMDKLARALSMDRIELRLLNALKSGDTLITGQNYWNCSVKC